MDYLSASWGSSPALLRLLEFGYVLSVVGVSSVWLGVVSVGSNPFYHARRERSMTTQDQELLHPCQTGPSLYDS